MSMGRGSKKSKKSKHRQPSSGGQKQYSSTENVAYYFLAAIGVFVLIAVILGVLGYFKVF